MELSRRVRVVAAVVHAFGLWTMGWAFGELHSMAGLEWIAGQRGGHFQFLTIQGLVLAWLTFLVAVASDVHPTFAPFATIRRCLLLISMPLAVTISSIYWSLLLFSPSLILPAATPTASNHTPALFRIPLSLDLALHAAPALFLLAHFYLLEPKFDRRSISRLSVLVSTIFAVWYSAWVENCAAYNGTFPYPFLQVPFSRRIAIYLTATAFANACLRVLNVLHY